MKTRNKLILGAVFAGALVVGITAPANATTEYVGGGTWNYGVTTGGGTGYYTYSYYYHASKTHRSTACGSGSCTYSAWASPGLTSYATKATSWGASDNTAYWDTI